MKGDLSPQMAELWREAADGGGSALPKLCPQPAGRGSQDTGCAWKAQGAAGLTLPWGKIPLPLPGPVAGQEL